MGKFKVVEKFVSINGEARCAGELACFIRFAGCNLNCSYCDTKWANEEKAPYEIMSEEEIYAYIKDTGVGNVTLTGGEPLLQENIGRLLRLLSKDSMLRVEIETNGAVSLRDFTDIGDNITFTLDYKLPGSGMETHMIMDNYNCLRERDTVKFVVSDKNDLDVAKKVIEDYNLIKRVSVYLSSSFRKIEPKDIVEYMIENNMNGVKLQLQMHKYIWEPDRKGV
ncbi:MAG: putative 7-carboxy-7-deazaguanine synthase QueE [Lachnospiraceae bacterium]|nr:putative 7-carboxy-7-deazaguanine synthase QueE [Lachnospiraceae bacterium]